MTTENTNTQALARRDGTAFAERSLGSRGIDIQTVDDLFNFAKMVAGTPFVPYYYRTVESIAVAIEFGLGIGLRPLQAIQEIAVINGKPSLSSKCQLAIVRKSGLLEEFKEWYQIGKGDEWLDLDSKEGEAYSLSPEPKQKFRACCWIRRRGFDGSLSTYSVADAVTAKLWQKRGKEGQDTPWVTSPKRMLKHRARTNGMQDEFSDVLLGLITHDEAWDLEPNPTGTLPGLQPPAAIEGAIETPIVVESEPPPVTSTADLVRSRVMPATATTIEEGSDAIDVETEPVAATEQLASPPAPPKPPRPAPTRGPKRQTKSTAPPPTPGQRFDERAKAIEDATPAPAPKREVDEPVEQAVASSIAPGLDDADFLAAIEGDEGTTEVPDFGDDADDNFEEVQATRELEMEALVGTEQLAELTEALEAFGDEDPVLETIFKALRSEWRVAKFPDLTVGQFPSFLEYVRSLNRLSETQAADLEKLRAAVGAVWEKVAGKYGLDPAKSFADLPRDKYNQVRSDLQAYGRAKAEKARAAQGQGQAPTKK